MGEWVSVLGKFLGFAITARRRAASFDFYRALGFEAVPVADGESAPYAALSDGVITIALHDLSPDPAEPESSSAAIVPTFVRPNLQACVRLYRRLGIELEVERLASDQFNQVGFSDPSGQPIRVLEAGTFSRGTGDGRGASTCGAFLELGIAARSNGHSQTFWEALGFKAVASGKDSDGVSRLEGYGLTIGLYDGATFPTGLCFRGANLAGRAEYLKAKGFDVRPGPAALGRDCAALGAPEGTRLYLLDD